MAILIKGELVNEDLKDECVRRDLVCSDEPMEMLEAILEQAGIAHILWLSEV